MRGALLHLASSITNQPHLHIACLAWIQADKWNHAGILVENGMLLHHLYGQLSQRVPYGGYWVDRTMKVVRYKDLM